MIEVRQGTLDEFFDSARESAAQIDKGEKVVRKKSIWLDEADFVKLLKPSRLELIKILRGEKSLSISDLMERLNKSRASVGRDLELLKKYGLVNIDREINPSHGQRRVVRPLFDNEILEFKIAV